MSIRELPQAVLDELDLADISWTILAELQFADGTVNVWTGPKNQVISYLAKNWVGTGDLGSITEMKETEDIVDSRLVGTLEASSANIDSIELEDNEGREATFFIVFFNKTDGSIIGHISDTREMGAAWANPSVERTQGQHTLVNELKMEFISEGTVMDRRLVRRLTHEDTLEMDPNDNFNEFASDPDIQRESDELLLRSNPPNQLRPPEDRG